MLVLTRKVDETIIIGGDIEVTILSISGDTVRVGINAPRNVRVLRSEVYSEILHENKEANCTLGSTDALKNLFLESGKKRKGT